ncbi:MAG: tetratricopeptide repeat protein [Vicinamibacterales bacterium]
MSRRSETREPWRTLGIVFAVALAAGVAHVFALGRAPWSDLTMGDAAAYDAWARRIAGGDWLGQDVFYQAPLYPYVLGILYRLLGTDLLGVRLVQAFMGAGAAVLLASATGRIFDRRAGLVAGLLLALYPPVVFSYGLLQKSVLDILFVCAIVWLVAGAVAADAGEDQDRRRAAGRWLALGGLLGGLMLTRENAAVFVAAILAWLLVDPRFAGRRPRLAGLVLAGATLVLAPVATRNAAVGGEFHLTTSQLGPNLYIGNNPEADGTYRSLLPRRGNAQYERQDAVDIAEAAAGRPLSPAEVSGYFTGQVLAYIRSDPAGWVRLLGRKVALVWNDVEMADTDDQYTAAEWSPVLRLPGAVLHMGVLAPLALAGLIVTWRETRRLWVLHALLASYAASVVLFFVFARYRLPLVPILVVFAAAGLVGAPAWWRRAPVAHRVAASAAVVAFAAFCRLPIAEPAAMRATMHYNIGAAFLQAHRREEALAEFQAALALGPALPEANNNIGIVLGQMGRVPEALAAFDRALAADPGFVEALDNAGEALLALGRPAEARERLERALALAPDDLRGRTNLGHALAATGDAAGAERAYRQALALAPGSAALRNSLAALAGRQGRLEESASLSREALALDPGSAAAENNLGMVAGRAGRLEEAARHFARAAALDPESLQTRRNLAAACLALGRLDEARAAFEAALRIRPGDEQARLGLEEVARRERAADGEGEGGRPADARRTERGPGTP